MLAVSTAISDGTVYFGTYGGTFYALETETGNIRWTSEKPIGTINCDPIVVDGTVMVGDLRGHLRAFDASTGEQLWTYRTGNAVHSTPVVTDDTIYFGSNDGYIYAIERTS
ncbi:PQQ-binding-like beta-propeller repeat protein [Natrinema marinum]|uniref:outer membrane protein assembly factor BamB family protein n=1 Tax=Natrinema marinum TaxID=2961598 RepID=UPI0020C883B2|nr:PQQ-binding-like beta-propeller repeat protein [Natrinema marinum]